jgi:hypothetical protein
MIQGSFRVEVGCDRPVHDAMIEVSRGFLTAILLRVLKITRSEDFNLATKTSLEMCSGIFPLHLALASTAICLKEQDVNHPPARYEASVTRVYDFQPSRKTYLDVNISCHKLN